MLTPLYLELVQYEFFLSLIVVVSLRTRLHGEDIGQAAQHQPLYPQGKLLCRAGNPILEFFAKFMRPSVA